MGQQKVKHEGLSSLRGMAALLVFLCHLSKHSDEGFPFLLGRWGVVIFFLMMGYFSIEAREKRTAKQYLFNRFMRLYPIYWFLVTIYFVIQRIINSDYVFGIKDWLINLSLFNEFMGVECILGASWMLPVEIVFFCVLAVGGTKMLKTQVHIFGYSICADMIIILVLSVLACMTGFIRHSTGLSLPTAFFLLLAVGTMGVSVKLYRGGYMLESAYLRLAW